MELAIMKLAMLLLGVVCILIGCVLLYLVKRDAKVTKVICDRIHENNKALILPNSIIIIGSIVTIISFCLLIF